MPQTREDLLIARQVDLPDEAHDLQTIAKKVGLDMALDIKERFGVFVPDLTNF